MELGWFTKFTNIGINIQDLAVTRVIRIVVLDSGCRRQMSSDICLENWKDFVEGLDEQVDICGHGSLMVLIIHRGAPHARISAARIARNMDDLNNVSNITKGILWAAYECQADVICLALELCLPSEEISQAISQVNSRKRPVIFSASCGNFDREPISQRVVQFPASDPNVIAIFSMTNSGTPSRTNHPSAFSRNTDSIGMYGVLSRNDPDTDISRFFKDYPDLPCTGSSISAAVGAATTASLLTYLDYLNQIGAPTSQNESELQSHEKFGQMLEEIRRPAVMELLFKKMVIASPKSKSILHLDLVEFWNRFGPGMSPATHQKKYEFFLRFAQDLVLKAQQTTSATTFSRPPIKLT